MTISVNFRISEFKKKSPEILMEGNEKQNRWSRCHLFSAFSWQHSQFRRIQLFLLVQLKKWTRKEVHVMYHYEVLEYLNVLLSDYYPVAESQISWLWHNKKMKKKYVIVVCIGIDIFKLKCLYIIAKYCLLTKDKCILHILC